MQPIRFLCNWGTISFVLALCSFLNIYGSTNCRDEQTECWAWASSLHYTTGQNKPSVDFDYIHERLRNRQLLLQTFLPEGNQRNICLAEINFVLESCQGSLQPELVQNLAQIAKSIHCNVPLSNHAFISGSTKPIPPPGFQFITEIEADNAKAAKDSKNTIPEHTAFKMVCSPIDKNTPVNEVLTSLFIHPDKPYFLDLECTIERLNNRYEGVPDEFLPPTARLARQWGASSTDRDNARQKGFKLFIAKFRRLRTSHIPIPQAEVLPHTSILWSSDTSMPAPLHQSKTPEPEQQEVTSESTSALLENIADSEQKIIYYLDYITAYRDKFNDLIELMDLIETWYTDSGRYKASLIQFLMNFGDSEFTDLFTAINNDPGITKESFSQVEIQIRNGLNKLLSFCSTTQNDTKKANCLCLKLAQSVQKVKTVFEALFTGAPDGLINLHKTEISNKLNLSGTKKESNTEDFRHTLRMHRIKGMSKKGYSDANLQKIVLEVLAKESLFKDIRQEQELIEDKVLTDFVALARECLRLHPSQYISGIVLNIHSTYDCYSCAPDLARESVRKGGFADYLSKLAKRVNEELGRGDKNPVFRIVYSCETVRQKVGCADCCYEEKNKIDPRWYRSKEISFYQHYLPKSSPDTVDHGRKTYKTQDTENLPGKKTKASSSKEVSASFATEAAGKKPERLKSSSTRKKKVITNNNDDDDDVDDKVDDETSTSDETEALIK